VELMNVKPLVNIVTTGL